MNRLKTVFDIIMLKKIFRTLSMVVLPLFFIVSILSVDALTASATDISEVNLGDDPFQPLIEKSNENADATNGEQDIRKEGQYPDLGDDQVFPFLAGLDSYQ